MLGEPNSDADYREDPNVTSFHPSMHIRTCYTSVLHLPGGRQGYTYKAMHGLTWLRLSCDTRGHIASISVHQWSLALVSTQMRNVRCHGWLISDQYTPQERHFRASERSHVCTRSNMASTEIGYRSCYRTLFPLRIIGMEKCQTNPETNPTDQPSPTTSGDKTHAYSE